jgi:nucleoside 2-deoxyribosyltransferase
VAKNPSPVKERGRGKVRNAPHGRVKEEGPWVKIYLASPLGFAESTRAFMERLAAGLRTHVAVINPWEDHRFDAELGRALGLDSRTKRLEILTRINTEIGRSNVANIAEADGIVAVLDGVDVDSGTASEIGYGFGLGKRIYGLRTDFRLAGDNEASIVNLQIQYFIESSGGAVFTDVQELLGAVAEWAANAPI